MLSESLFEISFLCIYRQISGKRRPFIKKHILLQNELVYTLSLYSTLFLEEYILKGKNVFIVVIGFNDTIYIKVLRYSSPGLLARVTRETAGYETKI